MATKLKRVPKQPIDNAQLELALDSTLNAALKAAAIFCHQYDAAAGEPELVRSFLKREYADTLLIATDPCTTEVARSYGLSDELAVIIIAAQEVAEYASIWYQLARFGRVLVDLPFHNSINDVDALPYDYAHDRTRRLSEDLHAMRERAARTRLQIAR